MLDCPDELYFIISQFCDDYQLNSKKNLNNSTKKSRNRFCKLSMSEIVFILIMYQVSNMKNFKSFYFFLQKELKHWFPNLCSYQRFVELAPRAMRILMSLLSCVYASCDGLSIVDSTTLKICHIKREKSSKIFKGFAKKSKSTMGWFYGFKLHIITNLKGELVNAHFSYANVDDRKGLLNMCKKIFGNVIGDRGYIGKDFKNSLKELGINLITRGKKNMKNHNLSAKDKSLLNTRNLIESVICKLKIECDIEHTRHRSLNGLMINILCALIAYSFMVKKPKSTIKYVKNIDKALPALVA
jgi:Transposase DDE domain